MRTLLTHPVLWAILIGFIVLTPMGVTVNGPSVISLDDRPGKWLTTN